jgi:hypothetical protein
MVRSWRLPTIRPWHRGEMQALRFDRYHRVSVLRKNGTRYETAFFACCGCSVFFRSILR